MNIRQLYDRDITRRINPAVVVSEMDEYFITQEIDEYVFTPAITKNIFKFLDAIANKKEGKTGVWISGYYGSGKSHFIKYLFYCLHTRYSEKAFGNFKESVKALDPLEEPNIGLVSALQNKLGKLTLDEIIFNIDAVSDSDHAKERITRVLLNQLNQFRGYNNTNIALALYLEKPLHKKGVFDEFKEQIRSSFNETWDNNQIRFTRMYLDKVIDIAKQFDPDIDKEALKSTILNKRQDYTINFLIDEIKDYLNRKTDDHRLIFLIDEVSQYIGSDTTLLLNLQTIVEEIGSKIGPRVWVVCTAQQELSNLINSTDDKTEDFGKIFGRFETMISLESQDAAYITKKRVLDKNSDGIGQLNQYYNDNKGAIENQFVFDHDLYRNFKNKDDFILTYPFIPYQFRLISDVFDSFSNVGYVGEGVKNTERAILGITHFTANLCKDQDVGYFVPFDLFFNEQFEKNLTHHARNILDRAYNINEVSSDPFARRVANALFMVSNLGEVQSVNFPATIENLSLLMMEGVDTSKIQIQQKVEKVLDVLVNKNIIQVSEGKYRYLDEDEIEVAEIIKRTPVTSEDRLSYIYDDIIQKVLKPEGMINYGNKTFRIAIQIDDKQIGQKGDFNLKFSVYDNADLINIAHSTPSNDMVIGISEWFRNDTDLKEKILDYVRIQKYIRSHISTATGTRRRTINNFGEANKLLLKDILLRFEKRFMETGFVTKNLMFNAGEVNGATPTTRFQHMVTRHLDEVYNKHKLSTGYATSNADLILKAKSKQIKIDAELTPAELEMNTHLGYEGEGPVVGDIIKNFEKAPYGWKDISTLEVLLHLAKKGYRRFEWRSEEIDLIAFVEKGINSKEREALTVHKEKQHSKEDVDALIHTINNEIFTETLIPSQVGGMKEVVETFKKKLESKIKTVNEFKDYYQMYPFSQHLKNFYNAMAELYQIRSNDQLMAQVDEKKQELRQYRDVYVILEEFIENNITPYIQINEFVSQNKINFAALDETLQTRAGDLVEYLATDDEPWERFPQMKRIHKELHQALQEHVNTLREDVIKTYENIFEEIETHRQTLQVEDGDMASNQTYLIQKIKREHQISLLENHELKAGDFRSLELKRLEDLSAKKKAKDKGVEYVASISISLSKEITPVTIETPEQVDAFISKLREKLMVKLGKNKKLFIN
jgi:hypothetical protein